MSTAERARNAVHGVSGISGTQGPPLLNSPTTRASRNAKADSYRWWRARVARPFVQVRRTQRPRVSPEQTRREDLRVIQITRHLSAPYPRFGKGKRKRATRVRPMTGAGETLALFPCSHAVLRREGEPTRCAKLSCPGRASAAPILAKRTQSRYSPPLPLNSAARWMSSFGVA